MKITLVTFRVWFVVWITSLFFFFEFGLNNIFNALEPFIRSDYHLSAVEAGVLSSLYFYANIVALLPAGVLLDRFSPKTCILTATVVCIISLVGISYSHSLTFLAVARLAMGLGGGFCFIGVMRIVVNWVPMKRMATASGFVVTMGMLGGFMVQAPMTLLINHFGWRHSLLFVALMGLIIFLLILCCVQNCAPWQAVEYQQNRQKLKKVGLMKSLKMVLSRGQNWLAGLYTSMVNLPIYLLGALWGIPYLMRVHHFTNTQAASIAGMLFIGSVIGSPLMGALSDKIGSKKGLMFLGAVFSFVIMVMIIFVPIHSVDIVFLLFLALGIFTSTQVLSYPLVAEGNPTMVSSTAISVISMMCLLGGAVAQPVFGKILSIDWTGKLLHGTPIYTADGYQMAAEMLLVTFAIGFLLVFGIKEVSKRTSN